MAAQSALFCVEAVAVALRGKHSVTVIDSNQMGSFRTQRSFSKSH